MSTRASPHPAAPEAASRPDTDAGPPVVVRPGARIPPGTFDAARRVTRHHAEREAIRSTQAALHARPER